MIRHLATAATKVKSKICVIGSGPAGFYAAEYLQRRLNPSQIDIYERFPVPFGLVRYGVAPDHPNIKNVMNSFTRTMSNPNVSFYGNVTLGRDVTLKEFRQAYHLVILAYGADENRLLGIPGEDLNNVYPARKIVGWYNGNPYEKNLNIDLTNIRDVCILGQGNVAIDVARILLTPIDKLRTTDMTEYALEALSKSRVKNVHLIGRRGPLQAAFTIKELREVLRMEGCKPVWNRSDMEGIQECVPQLSKPRKRIVELMLNSSLENPPNNDNLKTFQPKFFLSPTCISLKQQDKLSVDFVVNQLHGEDLLKQKPIPTDKRLTEFTDMVVTSIGYKSIQAEDSIPFDQHKGITQNTNGRIDKDLYSCGWLSSGPVGVLLSTMNDAFRTADLIVRNIEKEQVAEETKPGFEAIRTILDGRHVQWVTWDDWLKIDAYEKCEGAKLGKPREKLVDIARMLEIAAL